MKLTKVSGDSCNQRAVLLFSGWGVDADMLDLPAVAGHDLFVVSDYTTLELDETSLSGYVEIVAVAWSYGVAMASIYMQSSNLPVTRRVAVNGTMFPVDSSRGISPDIFNATLASLDEKTLARFDRRMAGGAAAMSNLRPRRREVEALAAELQAIGSRAAEVPLLRWDEAIVSTGDYIVPAAAQLTAWGEGHAVKVTTVDGPHLPDFAAILARVAVDKPLVGRRFAKAASTYESGAVVQRSVAARLARMLRGIVPAGADVLEIGPGTGVLTRMLQDAIAPGRLTGADLSPVPIEGMEMVEGDAEMMPMLAASFDLIVSSSVIQWFNSPRRYFERLASFMKPGAVLAVATYGNRNFEQLDTLVPGRRIFPTPGEWREMLPGTLRVVTACEEVVEMEFDSAVELLRHISKTGVGGTGDSISVARMVREYPVDDDGKCRLTYHPIWIIAVKE